VAHLVAGWGYDASPRAIDSAVEHLMAASHLIDRTGWAVDGLRRLAAPDHRDELLIKSLGQRILGRRRAGPRPVEPSST
jgi:hypothetical protein